MLGIDAADLQTAGVIAGAVALILALFWRDFLAQAFDPVQARMIGLRVGLLHYGLLAILSATIVAMLSSVGIILAIAFLIAPGAIAFLLTRRFSMMLLVSVIVAQIAGFVGRLRQLFHRKRACADHRTSADCHVHSGSDPAQYPHFPRGGSILTQGPLPLLHRPVAKDLRLSGPRSGSGRGQQVIVKLIQAGPV